MYKALLCACAYECIYICKYGYWIVQILDVAICNIYLKYRWRKAGVWNMHACVYIFEQTNTNDSNSMKHTYKYMYNVIKK